MRTNDRIRRKFEKRLGPGEQIRAVVFLQRILDRRSEPTGAEAALHAYIDRYGLENDLAAPDPRDNQWCVVTDFRILFYAKKAMALGATRGELDHEFTRDQMWLRWGDFVSGPLRLRLLHFGSRDGRHNIQHTVLGSKQRKRNYTDEADLLVEAFGSQADPIDVVLPWEASSQ